jgi:DNA-binding NtrC family response regulator
MAKVKVAARRLPRAREQLRILVVEEARVAERWAKLLKRLCTSLVIKSVVGRDEVSDAVSGSSWDLILTDYATDAGATSSLVLEILRNEKRRIPCLVVSRRRGEDLAVLSMKQGACDFIPRSEVDTRLVAAVSRALLTGSS